MASTAEARRPPNKKATVTVNYNGQLVEVEYQPHQALVALLAHALASVGIPGGDPALALFSAAGPELGVDAQGQPVPGISVEGAGVKPGDQLVLRRRAVGGGAR